MRWTRLIIPCCAKRGPLAAVVACGVSLVPLVVTHPVQAAEGAFVVDSAEIAKPGDCKFESWTSFASNSDFLGVTSPACVANLGLPMELGFSLARFRSDREWGTELLLKGKTNILPPGLGKIGVGLAAQRHSTS